MDKRALVIAEYNVDEVPIENLIEKIVEILPVNFAKIIIFEFDDQH